MDYQEIEPARVIDAEARVALETWCIFRLLDGLPADVHTNILCVYLDHDFLTVLAIIQDALDGN